MLRGFIKFHCTECGNNFIGPDIEYAATIFQCHCDVQNAKVSGLCQKVI